MPVVGEFHGIYWRAKANTPPPPAKPGQGGYPAWQASVIISAVWGVPLEVVAAWWAWLRLVWSWGRRIMALQAEQRAVIERVLTALDGPQWPAARTLVRDCATTPGFHTPKAWIHYDRALRSNPGQAQNLHRHLKVVTALQATCSELSNPDAHLLAELAYQGFAAAGRQGRRVIPHPVLSQVS